MKIVLFSRPELKIAPQEVRRIFASLDEMGLDYAVNAAFADIIARAGIAVPAEKVYRKFTPDTARDAIMVSYGGDGTFLEAVSLSHDVGIPIVGVNHGHLGFLANVPPRQVDNLFRELKDGNYTIDERTMLEIEGYFGDAIANPADAAETSAHTADPNTRRKIHALNEFAVYRAGVGMAAVDVVIDGERLATYRGDGILVSTPTGSTAYSLSVGGPILSPDCRCLVVSPIAPHNLTMRPMVIPDTSSIACTVGTREEFLTVSVDHLAFRVPSGTRFTVSKAARRVRLVTLREVSFYDTLRNKMMWGLDGRDERRG